MFDSRRCFVWFWLSSLCGPGNKWNLRKGALSLKCGKNGSTTKKRAFVVFEAMSRVHVGWTLLPLHQLGERLHFEGMVSSSKEMVVVSCGIICIMYCGLMSVWWGQVVEERLWSNASYPIHGIDESFS
ncbi:hypothetical protein HPP92_001927 [Vanilla planifolia]|uniref:Uncharacterized protein n=1 Tax=Vanilla planifolia TaxID=51239 RepID=A0A835S7J8_VANPL|nr:hypothetical protein HPP92_001927 [Vanilla planifolia]